MNIKIILQRIISEIKTYELNKNNIRDYNTWIFGEWFGNKCSDNVMAFANYVAEFGDNSLKLFWLCNAGIDTSALHNRITVVERKSKKGIELQKVAGVAVMNQGYDDFSDRSENYLGNAITVNLWHGVMWKKIGFDSYPNNIVTKLYVSVVKKAKQYTYFAAPSDEYLNIFSRAFALDKGRAIQTGLPRNELFFDNRKVKGAREELVSYIKKEGIEIDDGVKIITYMPTFRDGTTEAFTFSDFQQEELNNFLQKNNSIIIQKAHERNINKGAGYGSGADRRIINIDSILPQKLLAATDILITDYSSCFFDFLLLDRPIIQFIYDYDYYSTKDRGLYYSWENVDCGNMIRKESDLMAAIKKCVEHPEKDHDKRMIIKNRFMTYESPNNCQIIYDKITQKAKTL